MSTPLQDAANLANAQLSTGPRSPETKAISAQNARKHGLSAKFIPLSEEERPAFEELEAALRAEVNPSGPLQEIVFRELLAAAWKRDMVNTLIFEASSSTRNLFADDTSDRVRKLQRHKNDQDRAFNRALRQLKDLQTTDYLRTIAMDAIETQDPAHDTSAFPGLADYAKITKQSQLCFGKAPDPLKEIEEEAKLLQAKAMEIFLQRGLCVQPDAK